MAGRSRKPAVPSSRPGAAPADRSASKQSARQKGTGSPSGSARSAANAPSARITHRYGPIYAAIAVAVIAGGISAVLMPALSLQSSAIGFFAAYLAATVWRLPRLNQGYLRAHADESDTPAYLITFVVLATLIAASASLVVVINSGGKVNHLSLAVGIAALVLGWLTIHAMFAFHYAYDYYETDQKSAPGPDGRRSHVGGLDFPGKEMPDALSFLYFSFVIAMTAQVSDVAVTSNAMRRLALLHGILSFFFNTVIIAIAVNVVVSLGH